MSSAYACCSPAPEPRTYADARASGDGQRVLTPRLLMIPTGSPRALSEDRDTWGLREDLVDAVRTEMKTAMAESYTMLATVMRDFQVAQRETLRKLEALSPFLDCQPALSSNASAEDVARACSEEIRYAIPEGIPEGWFPKEGEVKKDAERQLSDSSSPSGRQASKSDSSPSHAPKGTEPTNRLSKGSSSSTLAEQGEKKDKNAHRKKMFSAFPDADVMKDELKSSIINGEDAGPPYHETGMAVAIARSQVFEYATLSVIALNAFWLAIDADQNEADVLNQADPVFQVAEHLFCIYFTFELLVRFLAFARKRDTMMDRWFVFDSCLVTMMVVETWVLSLVMLLASGGSGTPMGNLSVLKVAKLLRMARMARLVRLLRAVPELMILVKGMAIATRSVICALALLVTIIYGFSIAMTTVTKDSPELHDEYFPTVMASLANLFLLGVMPDQFDIVTAAGQASWTYAVLLLVCILFTTLAGMNLMAAVLIEVVGAVSVVEKERLDLTFVKDTLSQVWEEEVNQNDRDDDSVDEISQEDFFTFLRKPAAMSALKAIGVDVVGLVDIAQDYLFKKSTVISFPDFMDKLLELRGNNAVTVSDMVNLRKLIMHDLPHAMIKIMEDNARNAMMTGRPASDRQRTQKALKVENGSIIV